jgi:hypothetical protein
VTRSLRRAAYPLALARTRLASRGTRAAILGAGIAAGATVLGLVVGGSLVAQDRSLERALARVAPEDRTVHVAYFGVPASGETAASLDRAARDALAPISDAAPISVVAYKVLRLQGAQVRIAGLDDLERWIRLESGRLPAGCTPERCEVIRIGGGGRVGSEPGIRLVEVGRARLVSGLPFAGFALGGEAVLGENPNRPDAPPFVLASGTDEVAALPALEAFYRSYAWVVPLDPDVVHPWSVDDFLADLGRARSTLEARAGAFELAAPTDELAAAEAASDIAARRLLLVGGQAAALLVAFALLAGVGMRRDVDAAWRRLTWHGGRRWQLLLLSTAEVGAVAIAGTVLGWLLAAGGTALVADAAGSPAGAVVANSLVSLRGAIAAVALALTATVVLLLALRAPAARLGGRSLSTADAAALVALAVIGVTLSRGELDARSLAAEGGTGSMLLLLPGLATLVAGVAAARLFAPALRLLDRAARGAGTSVRLAALSLARNPGRAAVALAFVVVSVALGLFALVYRATLEEGLADHVAYRFPADYVVTEDFSVGKLVPPLAAAPLARYEALPEADVVAVQRRSGSVGTLAGSRRFTLVGVPSKAIGRLRGWRGDFSETPLPELAERVAPRGDVELRGVEVPDDATELRLPVREHGGNAISLVADFVLPSGGFATVPLGTLPGGPRVLRAPVPPEARGARLLGIGFRRVLEVEGHAQGNVLELTGTLRLGRLSFTRASGPPTVVPDYEDWTRVEALNAETDAGTNRIAYFVTGAAATRFRLSQPTDGEPVPVVASPALAAAADSEGLLPLRLANGRLLVKVVGTANAFPTTSGDFVVADADLVATTMNADQPGVAVPNEIWVSGASAGARALLGQALREPPFDVLAVASRDEYERAVESEPLARGALLTLAAAAAVALGLSLLGLLLLLVSELRDERGELFDLEAQGVAPLTLRRHVRLRTLLVLAAGLLGGLLAGVVLGALVTDLVTLTADATAVEPPLVLRIEWPLLLLAVGGYVALAVLLVFVLTRHAFRARLPERAPVIA